MCLSRLIRQVLRSSQPFAARASLSKVLWRPHLSSPRRCLRINPGCLQVLQWLLPGWFFCANGDKIVDQLERASVQYQANWELAFMMTLQKPVDTVHAAPRSEEQT